MNKEDISTAIFGTFDGLTSVIGVITGILIAGGKIIPAVLGLAIASAVGMGAGEWLGDDSKNWGRASVMALATLVGTIGPAIPFFIWNRHLSIGICAIIVTIFLSAISYYRKSWLETFGISLAAALLTIAVVLLTGSGG